MKKDVLWGYLSQFLQYGASLLVLPLLLRKLSSPELGVWYIFMTISAFVTMLDMGFTPTLARNVSYVMGGAKQLLKDGYELVEHGTDVDYGLLKAIITSAQRIFLWISVAAVILLLLPGSWYILHVTQGEMVRENVLFAWGIFVLATVINLYFKYYTPLLQGRGLYVGFYKSSALANIGFIIVTGILLQADMGLPGVACGFLVSALLGRWLSWCYFYDKSFKEKLSQATKASVNTLEIFAILWHNAWRLGFGVIGAFLILRANTLLSSAYMGLATTAAYALTLQVFSVLQNISTVVFNVQQPRLAHYRLADQYQQLVHAVKLSLGSALILFIFGWLVIVSCGTWLMTLISANTQLLPLPLLSLVGLMVLLELGHSLAAGVIVSGNSVPFVIPALVSGAAIFILSWLGLEYGGYGIAWLIGVQFAVQLAYNNWKWPLVMYQDLKHMKRQID